VLLASDSRICYTYGFLLHQCEHCGALIELLPVSLSVSHRRLQPIHRTSRDAPPHPVTTPPQEPVQSRTRRHNMTFFSGVQSLRLRRLAPADNDFFVMNSNAYNPDNGSMDIFRHKAPPHSSHPDFANLTLLVFEAVLEVVCVSLPGYIVARMGMFDADAQKFVANLNTQLFTPCLSRYTQSTYKQRANMLKSSPNSPHSSVLTSWSSSVLSPLSSSSN
jgi:hypothetical protein